MSLFRLLATLFWRVLRGLGRAWLFVGRRLRVGFPGLPRLRDGGNGGNGPEEESRQQREEDPRPAGAGPRPAGAVLSPGAAEWAPREVAVHAPRALLPGEAECGSPVDTVDEFYCCYDSTWDSEPTEERSPPRRSSRSRSYKFQKFENAARDMQNYRHNYPNLNRMNQRKTLDMPNLSFYTGRTCSLPDGVHISVFHKEWYGNYEDLEHVHTFIQWLFPLQEPGMNHEAKTLTPEEIQEFLRSYDAKKNLLKSYKLMLDFYGIEMYDEETGELQKATHWEQRFNNLNSHTHNSLRITRILKCLGTLGFQHYQAPLVHFFLNETLVQGLLPNIRESVLNYFVFAVLDKKKRRELIEFAYRHYDPNGEFVWCPKKIQESFKTSSVSLQSQS